MNQINAWAGYIITAVVILCICYMFFYESVKKDDKAAGNDKYAALYNIAKMIVANFDPAKLPSKDITEKALPKVQEQAERDNIQVTDDVASGAIKQAIKDGKTNVKNG